jgi:hypothetical protein
MKFLVVPLLITNILYFIWSSTLGSTTYTPPTATLEGTPSLVLLASSNTDIYRSKGSKRQSSCYTFGPFNSRKTAEGITSKINKFGLATSIHHQQTMQTLNFFVYMNALASRKEAEKIVKDMSKHEIKDYSIVETGPYKNAIALGSFEDLGKARRHAEYVRYLGYDARYTAQKKPKRVFWINYDEPFGSNAPVMRWAKKVDSRAVVQKIPKTCDF